MTMRGAIPHFDGTGPNVVSKHCDRFAKVGPKGRNKLSDTIAEFLQKVRLDRTALRSS